SDAQDDNFDDGILITADSDQVPTVSYITRTYPGKRIIVGYPPNRHSVELTPVASTVFHINRKMLEENQLPDEVKSRAGFPLIRPKSWT
ncbi:MAG TPA: NYN domain-containing protein, partial [Methylomirabilota bacterium]|nr:NYN domain-containing protein [Methylomirabilota bacterium]